MSLSVEKLANTLLLCMCDQNSFFSVLKMCTLTCQIVSRWAERFTKSFLCSVFVPKLHTKKMSFVFKPKPGITAKARQVTKKKILWSSLFLILKYNFLLDLFFFLFQLLKFYFGKAILQLQRNVFLQALKFGVFCGPIPKFAPPKYLLHHLAVCFWSQNGIFFLWLFSMLS